MNNTLTWKMGEPIRQKIDEKRKLLNQMVGTLYPGIVWDEIEQLSDEHKRITGESYFGKNRYD